MPESATQPQSDTPSDTQPVISEPLLAREPPPARWRVSKSVLLLIGGPLAGALLVWLAISIFSSSPTIPPEAVTEQPAVEPAVEAQAGTETQPAYEAPPAIEPSVVQAPAEPEPAPVEPEPLRQQPDAPLSAVNEVTPKVPESALNTISGTVRVSVRVTIDNEGNVIDAAADDPGPSRYFERISIAAARKWTFTPADSAEQRTMLVKFSFTREGVTAVSTPDEVRD